MVQVAAQHPGRKDTQGVVQDVVQGAEGVAGRAEPPWQLTGSWLQRARDELLEDPDTTAALLDRLRALVRGEAGSGQDLPRSRGTLCAIHAGHAVSANISRAA